MFVFRYPKLLFRIFKLIIPDIRNYAKNVLVEISKKLFWISENKHLYRISKIVILDIRNSYF